MDDWVAQVGDVVKCLELKDDDLTYGKHYKVRGLVNKGYGVKLEEFPDEGAWWWTYRFVLVSSPANIEVQRERVARAICTACDEIPDHAGDAKGNEYRWQDYLEVADAAIAAYEEN